MGFMRIASTCPACRGEGQVVRDRCADCGGGGVARASDKVTVDVPPGIDEGNTLRVAGKGHSSPGLAPGHLYLHFAVEPDPRFERQEDDLLTDVPISFAQACLGGQVKVPTIDGEETITIRPGTQSGHVHTLEGHGVPHVQRRGRGDLHARLHVLVPAKLTDEQRQAVAQLDAAFGGQAVASEEDEGIFANLFRRKKKRR